MTITLYVNILMLCSGYKTTYNPCWVGVVLRTTRSVLTVSERSTAIGITTGMIGTTEDENYIQFMFRRKSSR